MLSNNASDGDKQYFLFPYKLLAMSDIEGNYEKYYQLLFSNNIIDANYHWIFGKGHLVIVQCFSAYYSLSLMRTLR